MMMIDGLQYSHWSRRVFEQMREGGLSAVHVTIAYHELSRETLQNIGQWNRLFEIHSDLIMPVHTATDIELAHRLNKVGIIFGFQNCSPIEDDIDLVAIFHQLGVRIMQLTYNNQSLLGAGVAFQIHWSHRAPWILLRFAASLARVFRPYVVYDTSWSGTRKLNPSHTKHNIWFHYNYRCGPCKMISPIFEQMAKDTPDVTFVKVDVDDQDDIAAECGVQAMPTFQFFKGGKKIDDMMGANTQQLQEKVDKNK